jgi:2',3'-cyclic-nucleotide 2'-phosphodiesterase (5'-nucleotidase family)
MATLLATAMRDVVGADAAFMNSGGVRAKRVYTDGTITYADLNAECPFPSSNVVIKVVGAAMSERCPRPAPTGRNRMPIPSSATRASRWTRGTG